MPYAFLQKTVLLLKAAYNLLLHYTTAPLSTTHLKWPLLNIFFSPQGDSNYCEVLLYEWFIFVISSLLEQCMEHRGTVIDTCWMNEWINEWMNETANGLDDYGQISLGGDGIEHLWIYWSSYVPFGIWEPQAVNHNSSSWEVGLPWAWELGRVCELSN